MEAQASTETRPLPGFSPRQGEGLPLFGKSFNYPPARANSRIDFQFDRAAFNFRFLPFTLPYPVPFRILGDERKVGGKSESVLRTTVLGSRRGARFVNARFARRPSVDTATHRSSVCRPISVLSVVLRVTSPTRSLSGTASAPQGWLDVTYMSADGHFRLSRGNKGTLFVLSRDVTSKERLLAALERGDDEMVRHSTTRGPDTGFTGCTRTFPNAARSTRRLSALLPPACPPPRTFQPHGTLRLP